MRACVRAIKHSAVTLSREHLEKTALSISQCEKILAESREGESRLNDSEDSRLRFRTLLGIEPQARGITPEPAPAPPSRNPKSGRVGQRNPRLVGDERCRADGAEELLAVEHGARGVARGQLSVPSAPNRNRNSSGGKPHGICFTSGGSPCCRNRCSGQPRTAATHPIYEGGSDGASSHEAAQVLVLSGRPHAQRSYRSSTPLGFSPRRTDLHRAAPSFDSTAVGQHALLRASPARQPCLVSLLLWQRNVLGANSI